MDWISVSHAHLCKHSNVIVLGKATGESPNLSINVERTLKGTDHDSILIGNGSVGFDTIVRTDYSGIFFLESKGGEQILYTHPSAFLPTEKLERITVVLDMFIAPGKHSRDSANDADLAEIIGYLFHLPEMPSPRLPSRVADMSQDEAIHYLHDCLNSNKSEATKAALDSLAKMRDLTAVPIAIKLMDSDDTLVRKDAIRFLEVVKDPKSTDALCDFLKSHYVSFPKYRDYYMLRNISSVTKTLGEIADSNSIPILELAASKRIEGTAMALSKISGKESFHIILDTFVSDSDPYYAFHKSLYTLVRRSNQHIEKWMYVDRFDTSVGKSLQPKWSQWWAEVKDDFKIIRTYKDALKLLHKPF